MSRGAPLWPAAHLPLKGGDGRLLRCRAPCNARDWRRSKGHPISPLRGRWPAGQRGAFALGIEKLSHRHLLQTHQALDAFLASPIKSANCSSEKGSPSAVPWISTMPPLPVMTKLASVSAGESSI